jgi:hypothetical protein
VIETEDGRGMMSEQMEPFFPAKAAHPLAPETERQKKKSRNSTIKLLKAKI